MKFANTRDIRWRRSKNEDAAIAKQRREALTTGLLTIGRQTELVPFSQVFGRGLCDHGLTMTNYRFNREAFADFCQTVKVAHLNGCMTNSGEPAEFGKKQNEVDAERIDNAQTQFINAIIADRGDHVKDSRCLVHTDAAGLKVCEGIVGPKYGDLPNHEVVTALAEAMDNMELENYVLYNRCLRFTVSHPIPLQARNRFEVGDPVRSGFSVMNDETGHSRLVANATLAFLRCTNGAVMEQSFELLNAVHRQNIRQQMREQLAQLGGGDGMTRSIVESARRAVDMLSEADRLHVIEQAQPWHKTKLSNRFGSTHIEHLLSDKVKAQKDDLAPSVFEVFNAITDAAHRSYRDPREQRDIEKFAFSYAQDAVEAGRHSGAVGIWRT